MQRYYFLVTPANNFAQFDFYSYFCTVKSKQKEICRRQY